MKKFIAIALAVLTAVMVLALAGCGDKKNTEMTDLEYIKDKGTLVIGITDFDPMNYKEAGNDKWVGFDTELAEAVCKKLGVTPEFKIITWDYKDSELKTKSIDCVWNGMTITDAVKEFGDVTGAYMTNYQVIVVKDAAKYNSIESLKGQIVVAEGGSAGEAAAKADATLAENFKPVEAQQDALLQVKSGQAAACVIDYVMAASMLREGKSYADLAMIEDVKLGDDEFYGIACRTDSDLVEAINTAMTELYADGTVKTIADKYLLTNSLVAEFKPSEN